MPCRFRSSITISRKSMLSICSWSRSLTSDLRLDRSSSGAMSAMMSITRCLHSSLVIGRSELGDKPLHNQRGIYPEHTKRVIEDGVNSPDPFGVVQDEARQGAGRVEFVHVDRRVHDLVREGRQVARQLKGARGPHAVADEALGVVDVGVRAALPKDRPDGLALLDVALRRGGGVGVDDVDVARPEPGVRDGPPDAFSLAGGIGQDEVAGVAVDALPADLAVDLRPPRLR